MKQCKLCKYPIESWQSYQYDFGQWVHLACALGQQPKSSPTAQLMPNESITFSHAESQPKHKDIIDSEEKSS